MKQMDILDAFIAYGTLPDKNVDLSVYNQIDGVWLWVNGSDPRHALARSFYAHAPTAFTVSPFEPTRVIYERLWPDEEVSVEFSETGLDTERSTVETSESPADVSSDTQKPEVKSDGALNRKQLQNTNNRFRDNGELQYSLRSARMWLQDSLRTQHLITTDFWPRGFPHPTAAANSTFGLHDYEQILNEWRQSYPSEVLPGESAFSTAFSAEYGNLQRRGQYPQWMKRQTADSEIRIHHDWLMAMPLHALREGRNGQDMSDLLFQWRQKVVPTFNSMSAETVLGLNIAGLTDTFFYSNDDMFFNAPMSASDFGTPLYGLVLRLNAEVMIVPERYPEEGLGEGPSLFWSNWLLSQRFGTRDRSWFYHYHKAYSRAILFESRLLWAEEFDDGAMNRFRKGGIRANSHFLTYHFMVERHREALLWSFIVLRLDRRGKGQLDEHELHLALLEMGMTDINKGIVEVQMPHRSTLNRIESDLAKAKVCPPGSTEYLFTSMDGTASARLPQDDPDTPWPDFSSSKSRLACRLDISSCWPAGERDLATIFRRFAFEKAEECGDCLITLLMGKRVEGLNAFLPVAGTKFEKAAQTAKRKRKAFFHKQPPHLPLVKSFEQANFTSHHVAALTGWQGRSMRTFAVMLIHRYSYVIGTTSSFYWSLKTRQNVQEGLQGIRTLSADPKTRPALICLNDDLEKGASARRKIHHLLFEWYEEFFPQKLKYE